jgi:sialic acid synthase SpsE
MQNNDGEFSNRLLGISGVYIIAEIGNNHNGSIERAKRLVDSAKESGVIALSFK